MKPALESPQEIRVGISSCLLGMQVRYNGGHQLDHYLSDVLGQFVRWIPVCPEVECGLPTPREAMHLVEGDEGVRLVTIKSGTDHTGRMTAWTERKLNELGHLDLSGFVFKSRSPSSGMERVKVYPAAGGSPRRRNGTGIFADAFMKRFPLIPVEDEGRLNDAKLRENFIERVFVYARWIRMRTENPTMEGLLDFHTKHKLLITAHSPARLKDLGHLVSVHPASSGVSGESGSGGLDTVLDRYISILMNTLELPATVRKNVNVLQHIMGYFKKELSPEEKQELLEVISHYHREIVPLVVPVTMLNHYVMKYEKEYLEQQYYLHPHPAELMLRNHV